MSKRRDGSLIQVEGRHAWLRGWPWVLLGCAAALAPTVLRGQSQPAPPAAVVLPRTEVRLFQGPNSPIEYKLYVSLPPSYAEGKQRYPVLVLLDADYSFAIARNVSEHLSDRQHLPELIVVGVAYGGPPQYRLNRTRDYTPTHVPNGGYGAEYQTVSGGAPAFRDLLADGILPFIDRTYRTIKGERALVGHSFGGLFGTFVLFTRPELFNRYVIVSPSLWYDNRLAFKLEETFQKGHSALPAKVYYAVGALERNGERNMVRDLDDFVARVEGHGYSDLKLRHQRLDDETHNSVFPRALSNGLRFVFDGR